MRFLVSKPHNLVFDRGAVTRANAIDVTAIHCGTIQIIANNLVCLRVRVRDATCNLPERRAFGHKRKQRWIFIRRLLIEFIPSDRPAVEPWRCPGFQPTKRQVKAIDPFCQTGRGVVTHTTTGIATITNMYDAP